MEKEFVPYAEAFELRDVGFDEPCICGYSKSTEQLETYSRFLVTKDSFTVDAPTFSQAFGWFREKYNLHIGICHSVNGKFDCWTNDGQLLENGKYCDFNTYKEAELACLEKLIEIIKTK